MRREVNAQVLRPSIVARDRLDRVLGIESSGSLHNGGSRAIRSARPLFGIERVTSDG